jgi:molecular chaperone DnaK
VTEVAVDFGTCNSVLARHNEATGRAETLEIPGVSSRMAYRLKPGGPELIAWVIPSLIHYSETETLIGEQVLSRGLAEHSDTMRWMKRSIARGISKKKKTAQGFKSPDQAGQEFISLMLNYASQQISFENDAFTFTAPVEAFENFQDWLWRICESLGIRRVRLLDEPTACVFGYHGAARKDERFIVFDFGGGTLDVATVRIDHDPGQTGKAVQLGQAGRDLGGMDLDSWIAEDFCARHGIEEADRRELEAVILRQAEAVKMSLSEPDCEEADMTVLHDRTRVTRVLQTSYTRSCGNCNHGRASVQPSKSACLGCLMASHDFMKQVRETIDRSLENAAVKAGMRRSEITRVLVTGGTSIVPAVRKLLDENFGASVEYDHPFDCVARGACRGIVEPILQHDYAIESYNRDRKEYEFKPLFKIGTEYPTRSEALRLWCNGSCDGQTKIGLKIFEVSRMKRRTLDVSIVDAKGALREDSRVASEFEYICLNPENPTFILANPPMQLERDKKRFLCSFSIDGNRRLVVTVFDNLSNKPLLKEHPVVRL